MRLRKDTKNSQSKTVFGPASQLTGHITANEDVEIYGSHEGEITGQGNILIGPEALVQGNIAGISVSVSGAVKGNIYAKEEVVLSPTARVSGDITAIVLSIAPGAVFSGKSLMKQEKKPDKDPKPAIEIAEEQPA